MKLSFRNRLAISYLGATAIIIAVVFGIVFFIVKSTVYQNIDRDLSYEARKHSEEIEVVGDHIHFVNKAEWEEREHRVIQVNPVFIQLIDEHGSLMDKSPNLKEDNLPFESSQQLGKNFDSKLNNRSIRQVQIPIMVQGKLKGYIIAAMSMESSNMVISNLKKTLLILYPIILLGVFFISRFLAGRSIVPIRSIISTSRRIRRENLSERVELPPYKDELYELSYSINSLLDRIEKAIQREKQFTSDASHELRTPLATLRGTLEVLIRKPRSKEEYEEKIRFSLTEINKMSHTLEQLLLLARFNENEESLHGSKVSLISIVENIIDNYVTDINKKSLIVKTDFIEVDRIEVPEHYSRLMLDNIIQNAIKYSKKDGNLTISAFWKENETICQISDEGIGIKATEIEHIFNPFFRSDALNHKEIHGNGLGLSIAQKAATAIGATLSVKSEVNSGTTFTIRF